MYELQPGDSIYLAPNSWTLPVGGEASCGFGLIVLPECLRLIIGVHSQDPQRRQVRAYHTASPLSGAAGHLVRALNCLAEEGSDDPAARDLFVGLLRLARRHVEEDVPVEKSSGRAVQTWRNVKAYLDEHFTYQITRQTTASELGLHPNYLSALARQVAGEPFQEVLEGVRMRHARQLLADTNFKLARIAALCGYRNAQYFIKAFRRRNGMTPGQFRLQSHP